MSRQPRVSIAAPPARVWSVLADIEAWPSWSPSVVSVQRESADGAEAAYRIDQPPLPRALWEVTQWLPLQGFTWQTRGASSVMTVAFALAPHAAGTDVSTDVRWSGAMAWLARATYGPVSLQYADSHLAALSVACQ